MKTYRLEILLGVSFVALFAAVWHWLAPGDAGKLTRAEVDAYVRQIEPRLPMEPAEKAETLVRLRGWGEADDGEPVYMLNLMRYFDQLKRIPGTEAVRGTPTEANKYYEDKAFPMLARTGGSPLVGGPAAGVKGGDGAMHSNLFVFDRDADDWSRVLVVRYPNRRAFFNLVSDPAYHEILPWKLASLKVALVPVKAELVVPDPRWIVGFSLLSLLLAIGWVRAARRR